MLGTAAPKEAVPAEPEAPTSALVKGLKVLNMMKIKRKFNCIISLSGNPCPEEAAPADLKLPQVL